MSETRNGFTAWEMCEAKKWNDAGNRIVDYAAMSNVCRNVVELLRKTYREEVSGSNILNLMRLEEMGIIPVFDVTGNLFSTKTDYTLDELCKRESVVEAEYGKQKYLTRKESAAYLSYMEDNLDAAMKAAEAVIRYAVMTEKSVTTDVTVAQTPLTLDNVSVWLDSVPRLDLMNVAMDIAYKMKDKCDIRFDTTGTILTDKSRGELVGSLSDVINEKELEIEEDEMDR